MIQYPDAQWLSWIDKLAENDYVVIDNFLSNTDYQNLIDFFCIKQEENQFDRAGIGAAQNQKNVEIRSDFTYWIEPKEDQFLSFWFDAVETIKSYLNRYCFLSLSGQEFHLAHYPKGSFYKKHLDQFKERNNRMITVLLYLNDDWTKENEGELVLYLGDKSLKVAPIGNRLVLFKSGELYHEVLPTKSGRNSLTGWLLYEPAGLGYLAI